MAFHSVITHEFYLILCSYQYFVFICQKYLCFIPVYIGLYFRYSQSPQGQLIGAGDPENAESDKKLMPPPAMPHGKIEHNYATDFIFSL